MAAAELAARGERRPAHTVPRTGRPAPVPCRSTSGLRSTNFAPWARGPRPCRPANAARAREARQSRDAPVAHRAAGRSREQPKILEFDEPVRLLGRSVEVEAIGSDARRPRGCAAARGIRGAAVTSASRPRARTSAWNGWSKAGRPWRIASHGRERSWAGCPRLARRAPIPGAGAARPNPRRAPPRRPPAASSGSRLRARAPAGWPRSLGTAVNRCPPDPVGPRGGFRVAARRTDRPAPGVAHGLSVARLVVAPPVHAAPGGCPRPPAGQSRRSAEEERRPAGVRADDPIAPSRARGRGCHSA